MVTNATVPNPIFDGPTWTSLRFVDDEVMDDQFKHHLEMMFFGMSDLGECLEVARRLRPQDEDSWVDAWSGMARVLDDRAVTAERHGKSATAASAYLRASTYWRAGLMHFGHPDDPRQIEYAQASKRCYDRYLALSGYPGEYLEIPYENSYLPAHFYRSPVASGRAPLLVFNQGRDAWPEDTRWVYDGAIKRGIHCLAFHGGGQGLALRLNKLPLRHDWERVVGPVLDVGLALPGVDTDRVAIMGLSFGGYLAPRAAAFDARVKICIANPGCLSWSDMLLQSFPPELTAAFEQGADAFNATVEASIGAAPQYSWFMRDMFWKHGVSTPYDLFRDLKRYDLREVVDQIRCEVLVMDGTEEQFWHGQAQTFYDALSCPKHYMLFDETTTAQLHCQNGANATAAEMMYDWLDERL
jgi:hypothetical protein